MKIRVCSYNIPDVPTQSIWTFSLLWYYNADADR